MYQHLPFSSHNSQSQLADPSSQKPYLNNNNNTVHTTQVNSASLRRSPRFKTSSDINPQQFQTGFSPLGNNSLSQKQSTQQSFQPQPFYTQRSAQQQQMQSQYQSINLGQLSPQHSNPIYPKSQQFYNSPINSSHLRTVSNNHLSRSRSPNLSPNTSQLLKIANGNIKSSNAYIQAMKALQNKIKNNEEKLEETVVLSANQKKESETQIQDLNELVEKLNKQIQDLHQDLENEKLNSLQDKKSEKETEIQLKEQILNLQVDHQNNIEHIQKLESDLENQIQHYNQLDEIQKDYLKQNMNFKEETGENNKMISFLNNENDNLKERLQILEQNDQKQKDLIYELENQKNKVERKYLELSQNAENDQIHFDTVKKDIIKQQEQAKNEYNQRLKEVIAEKTEMFHQITSQKQQLSEQEENIGNVKEQLVEIQAENSFLKERWDQLQEDNAKIRQQSNQQREQNMQLLNQISIKEGSYKNMENLYNNQRQITKEKQEKIDSMEKICQQEKEKNIYNMQKTHILQEQQETLLKSQQLYEQQEKKQKQLLQQQKLQQKQSPIIIATIDQSQQQQNNNISDNDFHNNSDNYFPRKKTEVKAYIEDENGDLQQIPSKDLKMSMNNSSSNNNSKQQQQIYSAHISPQTNRQQSQQFQQADKLMENQEQFDQKFAKYNSGESYYSPRSNSNRKRNSNSNIQQQQQDSHYFTKQNASSSSVTQKRFSSPQFMNQTVQFASNTHKQQQQQPKTHNNNNKSGIQFNQSQQLYEDFSNNTNNLSNGENDLNYSKHLQELNRIEMEIKAEKYNKLVAKKQQHILDLELIRRQINDVNQEIFQLNDQYQQMADQILNSSGNNQYLHETRQQMVEISSLIQKKNQVLYNLKRKEDQLLMHNNNKQ